MKSLIDIKEGHRLNLISFEGIINLETEIVIDEDSSNMIVQTAPMPTWKQFLNQRIRWASKANSYSDKTILPVLVLVYCFNVLLLIALFSGIFIQGIYPWVCYSLMLKTIVEFIFMIPVARFFGLTNTLFFFPLMQPFHIVYTVIAGWLGKFGTYQWKGRMVK